MRARSASAPLALAALCAALAGCSALPYLVAPSAPSQAYREGEAEGGALVVRGRSAILILEGTPTEMGRQQGLLVGREVRALLAPFLERLFGEKLAAARADAKRLERAIPADYVEEMHGLAEAAEVPYEDLLLANVLPDVFGGACSAVAASGPATVGGEMLIGRNLEWPGFGYLDGRSLVTVFRPRGKRPFAAVTYPGLVGALSGINDRGVCVADLVAGRDKIDGGLSQPLRQRAILERAGDLDEALAISASLPPATSQNVIMADPRRAVVCELGKEPQVRPQMGGVVFATNSFVRPEKRLFEIGDDPPADCDCPRYERLERLAAALRPLDLDDLRKMLAAVRIEHINLQAMVFLPGRLEIALAHGTTLTDAAARAYDRIPLREFLGARRPNDPWSLEVARLSAVEAPEVPLAEKPPPLRAWLFARLEEHLAAAERLPVGKARTERLDRAEKAGLRLCFERFRLSPPERERASAAVLRLIRALIGDGQASGARLVLRFWEDSLEPETLRDVRRAVEAAALAASEGAGG